MRKNTKIILSISIIAIITIAFLGFCYYLYYKDNQISKSYTSIGEKLLYAGKTSDAIITLEKAIDLNPHNTHAEKILLQVYLDTKQYGKAINMQKSQLKLAPDKVWDYKREKRLGEIYLLTGDLNNAQSLYEEFSKKYTDSPSGPLGLALIYQQRGDLEKSIEFQNKAISLMKQDYKFTSKQKFKQELQKLADLYKKSGQQDLADKISQEIASIK